LLNNLLVDLYGNDETDFNDQANEEKDTQSPTEQVSTEVRSASTTAEEGSAKPIPVASTESNGTHQYIVPTTTTPTSTTPSFTQPATQQIPTYEQPQPAEYREPVPARNDGGYQNIPVNERTVRPSEMKDEG
jgi:hypothetical protein